MMKISMPIKANTSAAMMLPSGTRFILFASGVMVIEAVDGTIGAGIVTNGLGNIFQLADAVEAPAVVLGKAGASEDQHSIREIKFSKHGSILRTANLDGRMIAFGPAHSFETERAPSDGDSRNQQRQKRNAEEPNDRDVALHLHGIRNRRMRRIDFRLDAQIIVPCGNAGDDDSVFLAAFAPGAIAVVAVVIADFAAEIPGLLGIGVDERVF